MAQRSLPYEKENRKRFITRIATGEYDCVIMGFSQFEKINMSPEYREQAISKEIDEISVAIERLKEDEGARYSVKQYEKLKLSLESELKSLMDDSKKDTTLNFEELGFDCLIVDEAHNYKNCAVFTKMSGIAGIGDTRSKKSSDMLMKCNYINEMTNYKNIVFATGTPVANSMTELFVMNRYLRPDILREQGIVHFDNWAANYGEVVSSLELAPSGTGFRMKKRFARFNNLPELMTTFKTFADIKTSDALQHIERPDLKTGKPIVVAVEASEYQKTLIAGLAKRMEKIHDGQVKPHEDNALKVTHEARLIGTDPRLLYPEAENNPGSKVNAMIENVYEEYMKSNDIKGAQIIFCDVGTPKADKDKFTIYQYIKDELAEKYNIPETEIAFAHDADTEQQRQEQYADIRAGRTRVIIASTQKMGTGANVQERLIALHDLDIPWRPADLEQRHGRLVRQGNINKEVSIYQYVTKGTFDAYMWGILENKQKFISQIMTSKSVARSCEDADETVLSYAEVKAIATGDPRIKEKLELDLEIRRLQSLKSAFNNQRYSLQDQILTMPGKIAEMV